MSDISNDTTTGTGGAAVPEGHGQPNLEDGVPLDDAAEPDDAGRDDEPNPAPAPPVGRIHQASTARP